MKILRTLLAFTLLAPSLVFAQASGLFQPGGDLAGSGSTWDYQVIAPGAVTLPKQAALLANTIQGNNSNSPATPQALNPLQVNNLLAAVVGVDAICDGSSAGLTGFSGVTVTGTTLPSGTAGSCDGHGLNAAGETVLITGYTTNSQLNGIYVVGATWQRAVNFVGSIAANCEVIVVPRFGTLYTGIHWYLNTSSAVTVGTTGQGWSIMRYPAATSTTGGVVTVTQSLAKVVALNQTPAHQYDCVDYDDATTGVSGTVMDDGNAAFSTGPCVVSDPNGHPLLTGNGTPPTVAGTGCSLTSGSRDNTGSIVATGADTCTLTFGGSSAAVFTTAPNCSVAGVGATVLPYLNALPSTSAAVFKTTAAGTFAYTCL
jgi:hypothetical protein